MSKEPTLADLGEFAMIDRLVAGRPRSSMTMLGPGDDAAVVAAPDGRVVVSTDMLVESRHFRLDWSAPHDIGRKSIAQNAADVEAMGATATGFVVAFGAPAETPAAKVDELADGMWDEARRVGADIVGGDLVSSPQWVVSVTVLGDLAGRPPVTRSGATPGSAVAVCGDLGRSAAGYALWHNSVHGFEELRRRHLVPEPPYGHGAVAARAGAGAMTDVSDGLVADLRHIADASGVGIELSTAALAADRNAVAEAAAVVGADAWSWVLGGGEDHALVATFATRVPDGWRVIGAVVEGPPGVLIDGSPWAGSAGWQSFGSLR
jgi:thiamine-monophosphate kinase